jgi:hypothetical protein
MPLPSWLIELRRELITNVLKNDPRTLGQDDLLGVPKEQTRSEVIGWGQADFDTSAEQLGLSADDKVLLYAYWNQLRHIEELEEAFKQLLGTNTFEDHVVIDLGCGPFTGGLALGSVLGPGKPFTYIGVDRALAMHRLGETLAAGAEQHGGLVTKTRHWTNNLDSLLWIERARWPPVVVIVSYLLASPTLDATELVVQLNRFLARVGRGAVTLLYTNSCRDAPNQSFPAFQHALEAAGFEAKANDTGVVSADRSSGTRRHELRYALFFRPAQTTLKLNNE